MLPQHGEVPQPVECLQQDDRADRCSADPAASRVWEIRPVAPAPHQAWRTAEPQLIPGTHRTPVCRSRPSARKATRGFRALEPPGRTGRSDRAPERLRRRFHERGIGDPGPCSVENPDREGCEGAASRADGEPSQQHGRLSDVPRARGGDPMRWPLGCAAAVAVLMLAGCGTRGGPGSARGTVPAVGRRWRGASLAGCS